MTESRVRVATFGVILVFAYVLTFTAWRIVGLAAGMGDLGAVLLALIVDALTLLALVGLYEAIGGWERVCSWAVLVGFGGISVYVNALHARPVAGHGVELQPWQAAVVAALPPLVLLVGVELLHLGRNRDKPVAEDKPVEAEVSPELPADEWRVEPASDVPPVAAGSLVTMPDPYRGAAQAPLHVVPKPAPTRRAPASEKAARLESAREWLAENPGGSDGALAKHLGVGRTSAQRYREQLVRNTG